MNRGWLSACAAMLVGVGTAAAQLPDPSVPLPSGPVVVYHKFEPGQAIPGGTAIGNPVPSPFGPNGAPPATAPFGTGVTPLPYGAPAGQAPLNGPNGALPPGVMRWPGSAPPIAPQPGVITSGGSGCAACGTGQCDLCVDRWWASAEYLLWRTRPMDVPPLITTGSRATLGILGQPGTSLLYGDDELFDDERSGIRFAAGYWLDDSRCTGIEVQGFILEDANEHAAFNSFAIPLLARPFIDLNNASQFVELLAFPNFFRGGIIASAETSLFGGEANVIRNLHCGCRCRIDALIGFRYLELDDEISITETSDVDPDVPVIGRAKVHNADRFETENRFYGGQVGLIGEIQLGKLSVNVRGRVAAGPNHQSVNIVGSQFWVFPDGSEGTFAGGLLALPSNMGKHSRDEFCIVPEASVNVSYCLTESFRVFGGYTFLYMSNVLRAGDQIDVGLDVTQIPNFDVEATPLDFPRPIVPFTDVAFWAQGISVGAELRW